MRFMQTERERPGHMRGAGGLNARLIRRHASSWRRWPALSGFAIRVRYRSRRPAPCDGALLSSEVTSTPRIMMGLPLPSERTRSTPPTTFVCRSLPQIAVVMDAIHAPSGDAVWLRTDSGQAREPQRTDEISVYRKTEKNIRITDIRIHVAASILGSFMAQFAQIRTNLPLSWC